MSHEPSALTCTPPVAVVVATLVWGCSRQARPEPHGEESLRSERACGSEGRIQCSRPQCGQGCPSRHKEDEGRSARNGVQRQSVYV